MTEEKKQDSMERGTGAGGPIRGQELDAAGRSLSEALRISFIILKIIMAVLVVLFLLSGFKTVGSDERAIVLRFGKIYAKGESPLLEPGWNWVFPYPIDEIVRIPVEKKVNLAINSFWYYEDPRDALPESATRKPRIEETLRPTSDGYSIVRGDKSAGQISAGAGSDYNIVHCKWILTYQITDPIRFFQNVYVDMDTIEPGQNYADVIGENVEPLLKGLFEDSVVRAMVNYTIEEAISSLGGIPNNVHELMQERLDEVKSGVTVVSVQMSNSIWPRQVDADFIASIQARQRKETTITEAQRYRDTVLTETGGAVSEELVEVVLGKKSVTKEEEELLWSQLAGAAQERIAQAKAYRREVVESAKANAAYLQAILPEYRQRPELVLQNIYADAMEAILGAVDEKIVIDNPTDKQIRVQINRDPAIKPKQQETAENK